MSVNITLSVKDSVASTVISALADKYPETSEELTDNQKAKRVLERYLKRTTLKYIKRQAASRVSINEVTE